MVLGILSVGVVASLIELRRNPVMKKQVEDITQAAEDMGFHQASKQKMNMHLKDDTANGGAYQAPLVIGGTVSAAPLTMACVRCATVCWTAPSVHGPNSLEAPS